MKRVLLFILTGIFLTNVKPICEEPTMLQTVIHQEQAQPTPQVVSLGMFRLTAYCPCSRCCGRWANGITASGVYAQEGRTIAVDRRQIPLGTVVIIDGHEYIAEDVGGAINGNRIDIYHSSHRQALNFGVQYKEVFIKKTEGY